MHGFERGFMTNVVAIARKRRTTLALQLNRDGTGMMKRWVRWMFFAEKNEEEVGVKRS